MKYICPNCGKELVKEDVGARHKYYNCSKARGGCGKFFGILGVRYWWNVPAVDEFTGELIYNVMFSADGSYRADSQKEEVHLNGGQEDE